MSEQYRLLGTQIYVTMDVIVNEFFSGTSVTDLMEMYGESECAIEQIIRNHAVVKDPKEKQSNG